jgi:NADH-quinone oxidoreductase subunit L
MMAYTSSMFHVMTHAFFKALLFLGAGSVIHAMSDEQDIRKMGALKKYLPITFWTFAIATVAISGIPPFAGFFSKDEILMHVFEHSKLMWALAVVGSMMTSFYMFRLFFLTFYGTFRGTHDQEHHLHESPLQMTIPLLVLAVLSVIGGFFNVPEVLHGSAKLSTFLDPIYAGSRQVNPEAFAATHLSHSTEYILMAVSVFAALISIGVAYILYVTRKNVPAVDEAITGIKKVIYNKYYVDEIYNTVFVKPLQWESAFLTNVFEGKIFEGITGGINNLVDWSAAKTRLFQTGNTGFYLFAMVIGIVLTMILNFIL